MLAYGTIWLYQITTLEFLIAVVNVRSRDYSNGLAYNRAL